MALAFLGNKKSLLIFFLIILILAFAGVAGWSYYQYTEVKKQVVKLSTAKGQEEVAQKEVDALLNKVKKHMVLPDKEKPTIATVTDAEAIKKNQPFFEHAKNGDKVIVYVGAKKAIIYSPERDVIVNVGAVAVDSQAEGVQSQTTSESVATVEFRNGTATAGLARQASEKLKDSKEFTVSKLSDSTKKDYESTLIVDVKGTAKKETLDSLIKVIGGTTTTKLPDGEATSSADILVVTGKDQVTP